jgi:hypothetical protein
MAEKIISPGVFTNEIDQTFLPSAVADIGACIIGPTVKGPVLIPTVVSSFSEYQQIFGDVFVSGSSVGTSSAYQFLTSHTAEQYLQNNDTLTVVRILAGNFTRATADISASVDPAVAGGGTPCTSSFTVVELESKIMGATLDATSASITPLGGSEVKFVFTASGQKPGTTGGTTIDGVTNDTATVIYVDSASAGTVGASRIANANNLRDAINISSSLHNLPISASTAGANLVGISASINGNLGVFGNTSGVISESAQCTPLQHGSQAHGKHFTLKGMNPTALSNLTSPTGSSGGTDTGQANMQASPTTPIPFTVKTRSEGENLNTIGPVGTDSLLESGSDDNFRYEISTGNKKKGTFTLAIRKGNDTRKQKQIIETFTNINLDPNSPNYVAKAIGDQFNEVKTDENGKPFLQLNGDFSNKSRNIFVEVKQNTIDYLDENGDVRDNTLSASLPHFSSSRGAFSGSQGVFSGGSDGTVAADGKGNFTYENISENNSQGLDPSDDGGANGFNQYTQALDLISNQDEYDVNLIFVPGIIASLHSGIASKVIDVCEDRGDCFAVIDPVPYNSTVPLAIDQAKTRNSNFAAMYWPWIKVPDTKVGTSRWVPPSVMVAGVYAFNDRVAHPWFAPAGLNRGTIDVALFAERKLTNESRDNLYDANINPIATFPGQGVTVFGQKTLQKKASALDRINVRRLLINVKKFIASSSRFLVFEQNTQATRQRFLGIVNPFLENVQSQSGLSAFRVVMDDTNNTPDVVDRNQLVGQLFLQPTRTAEFVVLDFTIQPTGASFPE